MTDAMTAPPPPPIAEHADASGHRWRPSPAAWVATAFVVAFALAVLIPAAAMLEPDDYAYRAAIEALRHGHLWLSNSQYQDLATHLSSLDGGGQGIQQWVQRTDGTWISEKNPGYPFLAVPFAWLHVTRLVPVFYGALASIALYLGARRWIGSWGGALAVGLFLSSGAALSFGWRATMPTFTDASLIGIGLGLLLWSLLADDRSGRRRTSVSLTGLLALDLAVFCRYTDVIVLGLVLVLLTVVSLLRREFIPRRRLAILLGSQVLVGLGIMAFNAAVYGGATKTGYSAGEITFSLGALSGNLSVMPMPLLKSMPMIVLGVVAIVLAIGLWVRRRRGHAGEGRSASRDLAIVLGLTALWLGVFVLYGFYNWTAQVGGIHAGPPGGLGGAAHAIGGHLSPMPQSGIGQGGGPMGGSNDIHLIRFYVPALAPLALLGAFVLAKIPRKLGFAVLALLVVFGATNYHSTVATSGPRGAGFGLPGQMPTLGGGSSSPDGRGIPGRAGVQGWTPPAGCTPPAPGQDLGSIPTRCLPPGFPQRR